MRIFLYSITLLFHFFFIAMANPVKLENSTAELLSEVKQIQPGKPFWVVLHLTLKPGWHTYWINPGDSGMETQIEWELPAGFKASPIVWLAPQQIPFGRLVNFGYSNDSYHLVQITPPSDLGDQPQTLKAKANWLVCEATCIPEETELTLTLPVHTGEGASEFSEHYPLIHQLSSELPIEVTKPGTIELLEGKLCLSIEAPEIHNIKASQIFFFPEQNGLIKNAAPQQWEVTEGKATGTLVHDFIPVPQTFKGILQIHDEERGKIINYQVTLNKGALAPISSHPIENLSFILLFALLGGLILNAMPCVFPILSIKALSIAKKQNGAHVRIQGFAYTIGVVISFLVMAGILIGLQHAGHAIGWGFQMQSPLFVSAMVYLMFVLGLSLSGYVYLPFIGTLSGQKADEKSFMDSFWVGVLAVLVATPCTAPFMGVAVGYALSQPTFIILLVFFALALGFALPYFLITMIPSLFRVFPKPGAWMETLKEFLAFPLYATVVWLLWVLIQQSGNRGFLLVGFGLVLTCFSIWLYKQLRLSQYWARLILGSLLTAFSLSPLLYIEILKTHDFTPVKFSQNLLDELRSQGKPVFVNATAAWCITCKFNELNLKSESTIQTMEDKGIVFLEADWTNQDPNITAFLKSFERNGVPLYVFYPSKGEPMVLPQLLTPSIIQSAFANQPNVRKEK